MQKIGVLGLGIMGSAIAANIAANGHAVYGFDPDDAARRQLADAGGTPQDSAAEVLRCAEVFILSLPNEQALEATLVVFEEAGRPGQVVADASTLAVDTKLRAEQRLKARGITYLDCPLSGTGSQARAAQLTVFASGDEDAVARMAPVFKAFARATHYIGQVGDGMRLKLVSNLLIAIHNVSTAEALLLGSRLGLDTTLALKVLVDSAATSKMLEVRGPVIRDKAWNTPGMKIEVWQKDMRLIAQALADAHVGAPLFNATIALYNAAVGLGHARHDTAAVYDVLDRMAAPPAAAA